MKNLSYLNKIRRSLYQLSLSEKILHNHPLFKNKWIILKVLLHRLNLHMQATIDKPAAQLLMTFQAALHSQEIEKSQTGFLGPEIRKLQQLVAHFMQLFLYPNERRFTPLLLPLIQVFTIGGVFVMTHLTENFNILFPKKKESITTKKAKWLFKELSLTFILGSHVGEAFLCSIGKGLELKESSQKKITNIGLCFLYLLLILSQEDEHAQSESFLDTIKPFLQPILGSIEEIFQEANTQAWLDKDQFSIATNQIRLAHQALDSLAKEELIQLLIQIFEVFGLSLQQIKSDLQQLSIVCAKLDNNFKNIFNKNKVAVTTIQAA